MNIQVNEERLLETRLARRGEAVDRDADGRLEVNVVFTDEAGTLTALKTACNLAVDLGARINLIAMQAVPWALPLTRPPIAVQCTEQRLLNLVRLSVPQAAETKVQVCLCRDRRQALLKFLPSKSLVVIGGKIAWWPCEARRTAKMLERNGHRVIFAVQGKSTV